MSPNDADRMANSVDPDQTAPLGAVWSGSALFAQAYLSENLGLLRYYAATDYIKHVIYSRPWCSSLPLQLFCVLGMACERPAQSSPFATIITFPELNQVPIHCWVDSKRFPVFGSSWTQTCDLPRHSQALWPLDHRGSFLFSFTTVYVWLQSISHFLWEKDGQMTLGHRNIVAHILSKNVIVNCSNPCVFIRVNMVTNSHPVMRTNLDHSKITCSKNMPKVMSRYFYYFWLATFHLSLIINLVWVFVHFQEFVRTAGRSNKSGNLVKILLFNTKKLD